MPTFKNNTSRYIDHEALIQNPSGEPKKILVRFQPNETRELAFWLPYQKLGLTLVSADFPPVPNTILISGTFNFNKNTERKFDIEPCDTYIVNVIVQKGKVMMYTGNSNIGVEIVEDTDVLYHYKAVMDWEYSPYLKFIGLDDNTVATIHAEVDRDSPAALKSGGR